MGTALLNRSHQVISGNIPAQILPDLHQKFNYCFVTGAQHTTLTWLYKYIFYTTQKFSSHVCILTTA